MFSTDSPILAVLRVLPEAVLLLSENGDILAANPASERLFGASPGSLAGGRFQGGSHEQLRRFLQRCRQSGSLVSEQLLLERADGHPIPCRLEGACLEPSSHEPPAILLRVFALVTPGDPTSSLAPGKQSRCEATRDTNGSIAGPRGAKEFTDAAAVQRPGPPPDRLTFALNSGQMCAWEWDLKTGTSIRSDNAIDLLGLQSGQAHDFYQLVHPDDRARVEAALQAIVQRGEPYDLRFRITRADGQVRWIEDKAHLLRDEDGSPELLVGIAVDITDRVRAEEELLKFKRISDWSSDGHFLFDFETRLHYVNQRACDWLGYPPDELLQLSIPEIAPSCSRSRVQEFFTQAGQRHVPPFESVLLRKDGTRFPVEISITILRLSDELYLFAAVRDISERKQSEQALRDREELLRAFYINAPLLMGVVEVSDDDILHIYDNPATCRFFGLADGATAGKWSSMLGAPRAAVERWMKHYRESERTKAPVRFEYSHETPSGGRWLTATVAWIGTGSSGRARFCYLAEDVTDERAALEALRDNEEKYRATFDQTALGVAHVALDGGTLWVNPGLCQMLGYTQEELRERSVADVTHPNDLPRELELLQRLLNGEIDATRYEKRYLHKNGSIIWGDLSVAIVRDAERKPRHIVGVVVNTTDRKLAEEALRESEERFRGIVSHSIAGVAEVDLTGRFRFANERYCQIVGRSLDELRQLSMQDISHPEDLPANLPLFKRIAQDGLPYTIEKRYVRPDGSEVWVNNSVSGLRGRDGRIQSVVAVCVDVTDRRRAEAAHREGEERLRTLIDNLPHGAVYRLVEDQESGDLQFAFLSAGIEQLLGITAEEGLQNAHLIYDAIHENDRERVLEEQAAALRRVQAFDCEFRIHQRSGEVRWIHCRSAPHRLPSGQLVWEGVLLDVTSRKLAEEALRETDRRKDEFLAMLGHELRNPLAPIRSGLELLDLEERSSDVLALMKGQVDHLVRLVDDLLDVSRIMRGKIELRKEPVELARVISQAIETARPIIDGQRHELTRSLPPEPIWLEADPVRLTQVFANLLNNAAKYTPPHGQIWITAEVSREFVTVHVRDNGIGIEPELLPAVFDLFTQGDRAIDRSQGGLGIGLTVVKSLVEMHQGTVTASSRGTGYGCDFTVQLPILARVRREPAREMYQQSEHGYRILVVDDNVAAAKMLKLLLSRLGPHEIEVAHDGSSALSIVRQTHPQLILLDIGLPGTSGYEVAKQIRAEPENADILLVALTGYGTAEDRQESRAAGFDEHLVKPADIQTLRQLLTHPKLAGGAPQ